MMHNLTAVDNRMQALHELPKVLPAAIVMRIKDLELDALGEASYPAAKRRILRQILTRIESEDLSSG